MTDRVKQCLVVFFACVFIGFLIYFASLKFFRGVRELAKGRIIPATTMRQDSEDFAGLECEPRLPDTNLTSPSVCAQELNTLGRCLDLADEYRKQLNQCERLLNQFRAERPKNREKQK